MNQLVLKKKNELTQNKRKGFTLVELIIVIAIIAILAAMAIPKFSAVRLDARVSNDVAAAKNIQTQVAVLIANGEVKANDTIDLSVADGVSKKVKDRLDGKASSGKTEALSGGHFTVGVNAEENITVSAVKDSNSYILYPDNDGTLRAAYSNAVSGKPAPPAEG